MKKTDTLIVGQGMAGSLVAFMLHLRNVSFVVIDPAYANTSSRIAAGMFSPVSGKRKTIQPMVEQQLPFAMDTYRKVETLLGINILHLHDIYQVFTDNAEQAEMEMKRVNTEFAKYIFTDVVPLQGIKQEAGACGISHSGWLDCGLFIAAFAKWLKDQDALIEEELDFKDLAIGNQEMEYRGIAFSQIIFCEGYRALTNPFFTEENIIPCKGDVITIQYDHLSTGRIIKKNGIYLVPVGENVFRAGSTYQWNNSAEAPDVSARNLIEGALDAMLQNGFTTTAHYSGIRPTTKNREVIVMQHPQHTCMFMFNGLGTRGVIQGPWHAHRLAELVYKKKR